MFKKEKVNASWALSNVYDVVVKKPKTKTAATEELGVELELEGSLNNIRSQLLAKGCDYFNQHYDGSLASGGLEFTFKKPLNRADARKGITDFFAVAKEHAEIKNSDRCSTHMHLNFQHMSIMQVYNYLTLFYLYELAFFEKFAPERMGNGYCQPLFDCAAISQNFGKNLREGVMKYGMSGSQRYCALNVAALPEHGSLECRMLGESSNAEKPLAWMDILLELYDYVKNNPRMTPEEILSSFEVQGYLAFTRSTFPKCYDAIHTLKGVENMLASGVLAVQYFVYAVDWSSTKDATPPTYSRSVDATRVNSSSALDPTEQTEVTGLGQFEVYDDYF